jgi:AcrR family transcriptional regulator
MPTSYEASGRINQKRRTRDALVAAARDLVAAGTTPTIDQAASAAAVSRTTAYRYFPNQWTLLAAAHPETAARSLLPDHPPEDPAARLNAVIAAFTALIVDTEKQQRTMLRLSLDADGRTRRTRYGRGAPSNGSQRRSRRWMATYPRRPCTNWYWLYEAQLESSHSPGLPTSPSFPDPRPLNSCVGLRTPCCTPR